MNQKPEFIVRVQNLQKSYGELQVLRKLDVDVPAGQRVAIIGPSGSGKSTLLRLLMTLEKPDAGSIEIDGDHVWTMRGDGRAMAADAAHISKVRSKVGMVFQHFNLFPHMNVLRNVSLAPVKVKAVSKDQAEARAVELLRQVGLEDKVDAFPAQLSGGQKQRVAIARALAMEPKIMLFDEVTSALDPELVGEVLNVIRDLEQQTDMTMLIVTHEMSFARESSDRVLFFHEGKIWEDNEPEIIFTNPEQPRTREFLRAVLER